MTPKEKAQELLHNYSILILYKTNVMDELLLSEVQKFIKQCALISANLAIEVETDILGGKVHKSYWQEVKQEVEKL